MEFDFQGRILNLEVGLEENYLVFDLTRHSKMSKLFENIDALGLCGTVQTFKHVNCVISFGIR